MSVQNVRIVDGKKLMWDGRIYESEGDAAEVAAGYQGDGFETLVCEDGGRYLVYTRRVVKQSVVEGSS